MKKRYITPALEAYTYSPEEGYATTVALKDYVLVEGTERHSLLSADEVTEYQEGGEYTTGEWEL